MAEYHEDNVPAPKCKECGEEREEQAMRTHPENGLCMVCNDNAAEAEYVEKEAKE